MVRYFYAFSPLTIVVATVVLLSSPYLALIALLVASLGTVAALAWAIVSVPLTLTRAIRRRWQDRSGADSTIVAEPPAAPVRVVGQHVPAGAALLLAGPPAEKDA